jgi:hypothetical protein
MLSSAIFHAVEINPLDIKKPSKLSGNVEKQPKIGQSTQAPNANRGNH